MPTLLRTNKEIMEIYDRQVDTVYRVCYAYMKNAPEAEDMTQETFLRLMSNGKPFADQRHEKAWLIITASNLCKDTLKKWWRKNENIDDYTSLPQERTETGNDVLDAILALPQDYKERRLSVLLRGIHHCGNCCPSELSGKHRPQPPVPGKKAAYDHVRRC